MPWNEADRPKYDVIRARYSSDMSEAEFALIAPLLPPAKRRGRKRTDPQAILNALFYMIRCACPWRYLPKDFPPFTTVQNSFYAWRDSGLWAQILAVLVMDAREAEGRQATPTVVVVDSQSVKTTEAGGPKGFDAGKKVKGRKRHLAVDTLGLPIECQITVASTQDRDALAPLLKAVRRKSPWVKMSFVDGGYQGQEAQRASPIPSFRHDKNWREHRRARDRLVEFLHERQEPVFWHVRDEVVEHATLAEQRMSAGFAGVGLQ
jgi:transposase